MKSFCQSLVLVLTFVIFSGCSGSTNQVDEGAGSKLTKAEIADRNMRIRDNALDILQPQKLGISTGNVSAIQQLNDWITTYDSSEEDASALTDQSKEILEKYLTSEEAKELMSMRFVLRDGLHIRDCYLYKKMGEKIQKKTDNRLEQVVALFYYVTRLVELDFPASSPFPMTPQEVLMSGSGSAQDRAVIFAGILRQLKIDSILIQPASKNKKTQTTKSSPVLMGVLIQGKVYLFDMQLGLPIPALGDVTTVLPQNPATLADVLRQDEILRQLDVNKKMPYPLKAKDFQSLQIKIVINNRFWSVANFRLHFSLAGDHSAIVYSSLEDSESGDGIISRIMKFAKKRWKQEDISVWKYPEQQYERREKRDPKQEELRFGFLTTPVKLTLKFEQVNPNQQRSPSKKTEVLHMLGMREENKIKRYRMRQVLGDPDIAIRGYQQIRLKTRRYLDNLESYVQTAVKKKIRISKEIQDAAMLTKNKNGRAHNAVIFWTVICQIEQEEYQIVTKIIRGSGGLSRQFILAFSYAKSGKLAAASQYFKNIPLQNPYWRTGQLVQKRCRILRKNAKSSVK